MASNIKFTGVKVFSATMLHDRATLGEKVTEWLAQHPTFEVADIVITQSSDSAFHCIAITVFYCDPVAAARVLPMAPSRRLAFVSKHGDSPEEDVPVKAKAKVRP